MQTLANKVAVVTGASKGIGASIVKTLAMEKASVAVHYSSSKENAEKVVAEIRKAGGTATAIAGNLAKPKDIERVFEEARSTTDSRSAPESAEVPLSSGGAESRPVLALRRRGMLLARWTFW